MSQDPPAQTPAPKPNRAAEDLDTGHDPVAEAAGMRTPGANSAIHSTIKSRSAASGAKPSKSFGTNSSGVRHVPGDPLPPSRARDSRSERVSQRQPKVGLVVTDLLKLRISLDQTQGIGNACQVLAEQLCNLFDCGNVFISIEDNGRLQVLGKEFEDSLEVEDSSIVSSQREVSAEHPKTGWPESDFWQTSLVHKNLTNEKYPSSASYLMKCPSGERLGAITVVGEIPTCTAIAEKIDHICELVTPDLCLRQQASESVLDRLKKTVKSQLHVGLKWSLACCLLFAFFFVRIPHRIQCDTEAKPIVRRYVSAPFDSVLKSTSVRAGDSVEMDSRLALLDEDEIRLKISSSEAEQEKYRKLKSAALAKGDTLAMQQAQLEFRRLTYKNDLLKQRSQNLEITSPISGIVLRSEMEDAEGAPLSQGQVLFEIAPLNQMIFCVYISQQDISHVETGMEVHVNLDGADKSFTGKIRRIRPQAITFENNSVFVAEVEFDNSQELVRPGMRGYAAVVGHNQSIGWILFRKPVAYLKKLTGF